MENCKNMQLSDFNFELPVELIAQYPCKDRTGCRLLALDGNTGETRDLKFYNVIDFLEPGDLLVFNDTATTEIYTLSLHDALPISQSPIPNPQSPIPNPQINNIKILLNKINFN